MDRESRNISLDYRGGSLTYPITMTDFLGQPLDVIALYETFTNSQMSRITSKAFALTQ